MTSVQNIVTGDLLSDGERQRFEKLRTEALGIADAARARIATLTESFQAAQKWFIEARDLWHKALSELADDPNDDFEVAFEKARRFEVIDRNFDAASDRLGFEMRELQKLGISPMS